MEGRYTDGESPLEEDGMNRNRVSAWAEEKTFKLNTVINTEITRLLQWRMSANTPPFARIFSGIVSISHSTGMAHR